MLPVGLDNHRQERKLPQSHRGRHGLCCRCSASFQNIRVQSRLASPSKGNVSRFHESEDFIARLEFHLLDRTRRNNRRYLPNARLDDHFTEDFVGDNVLDRSR